MKRRTSSGWWLVGLMVLSSLITAAIAVKGAAQDDVQARVEQFMRSAEPAGFSGVVLVGKGDDILATIAIGPRDLQGAEPNTPDTLFEIASLTKSFTGAAVMRLVDLGKLQLDDSIADHLPGIPEDCRAITIEHLLRHTSGIPGTNSQGRGDRLEDVLPTFLAGGPQHEPGTHWAYWNQGYALLSEIIARTSGMPYTEFCRTELFEKAGMTSTCFTGDEAPNGAPVAIGRSVRGPARSALEHPYSNYGFQYRGMGGIVTSVGDLWAWHRALRAHTVLSEAATEQLFTPGQADYALGWVVGRDRSRGVVHSHGGGVRGFLCEMRRYPDHDDAVLIVLCNRDDAPLRQVVARLEQILFGEEPAPLPSLLGPLTALEHEIAQELAGRYVAEQGTAIEIVTEGGITRCLINWRPPNGPVTRSVIGKNEQGEIAIYDGREVLPVQVNRSSEEGAPITSLVLIRREFVKQ